MCRILYKLVDKQCEELWKLKRMKYDSAVPSHNDSCFIRCGEMFIIFSMVQLNAIVIWE